MGKVIRGVTVDKYIPVASGFGNDLKTVSIDTDNFKLILPDRAITYQEFRAKTEIGSDVPIDAGVALFTVGQLPHNLHRQEIEKLLDTRSEYFKTKEREAHSINGRYDYYFPIKLLNFTVAIGDKTRWEDDKKVPVPNTSGINYLAEDEANIKQFVQAVSGLTRSAEFDILTVPLVSLDKEVIKRTYNWILLDRNAFGFKDVVPSLSMKLATDELVEIAEFIRSIDSPIPTSERKVNLISIQYLDQRKNAAKLLDVSRRLIELGFATLIIDVERQLNDNDSISGIHTEAHIFGDSFSVKPAVKSYRMKNELPEWEGIKFLNTSLPSLEAIYGGMTERRFNEILREIEMLFGDDAENHIKILLEFRGRFMHRNNNQLSDEDSAIINHVRSLSRVHEFLISRMEFSKLRNEIQKGAIEEYVDSKHLLHNLLYAAI